MLEFIDNIKDFFNETGRVISEKVEIIKKVDILSIKIDKFDVDYLKNQKRELGNYIYNNLNNLK